MISIVIIDKETRLSLADQLFQMEFDLVLTDIFPNMLTKAKEYATKKRFVKGNCFEKLNVCDMHFLQNARSFDRLISTGQSSNICFISQQTNSEYCQVMGSHAN